MFSPEWKGPIEGYVVNVLKKNYWRVESSCEHDDVMQEAYEIFLRCRRKYPGIDTPQHFMALFKTAWFHHFTDLANRDTDLRRAGPMPVSPEGVTFEQMGETDNDGYLATLIRQAPGEVKLVLSLFLNAPQEMLDLALSSWLADGRRRNGGQSAHINRLLGLPLEQDTLGSVEAYFRR